MKSKKGNILISNDTKQTAKEIDRLTTGGHEIKSVEEFKEIVALVGARYEEYQKSLKPMVTLERAKRIREVRATSSWRVVAATMYIEWLCTDEWYPGSSQIAGIVLCEHAAAVLGEDPSKEPWV